MKKKTVGEASLELQSKDGDSVTPREQAKESLKDYVSNLYESVKKGKQIFGENIDLFVNVITKKERILKNVLRNYFTCRKTCPTPDYDQAVYRYDHKTDDIIFLWVIPARDVCNELSLNASNIPKEQHELLRYVLEFKDGTLYRKSKELNGEKIDKLGSQLKDE